MEIKPELKELGLDENEIKVYLACLSEKGVSVKEISDKTKLIRTTVYGVIHSLLVEAMISKVEKEGVMYFSAADPKELLNVLDYKREKLNAIIPELEKMKEFSPSLQKVDFYEGRNGVKAITNDLLSVPNEIALCIGAGKKWVDFSSSFADIYYRKKKEMNVKTHAILSDTPEERKFLKEKNYKNSQFKFLKNIDVTNSATFIYQDKVSFVSYEKDNERGFIIKDKEFNKVQRLMFENMWKIAK